MDVIDFLSEPVARRRRSSHDSRAKKFDSARKHASAARGNSSAYPARCVSVCLYLRNIVARVGHAWVGSIHWLGWVGLDWVVKLRLFIGSVWLSFCKLTTRRFRFFIAILYYSLLSVNIQS